MKAKEILKHIEELYTAEPDFDNLEKMFEKNPERLEMWEKAFEQYELADVLKAIDEHWEFKSSKSKPNVSQIKAKLNVSNVEKVVNNTIQEGDAVAGEYRAYSPAEWFMGRDIQLKRCRHNLYIYKRAVNYILDELLLEYIPYSQWQGLTFAGKVKLAKENKLFSKIDEALVYVCRRDKGSDYEFPSEADLEASAKNRKYGVA